MITLARLSGLVKEGWETLASGQSPPPGLDYLMLTKGVETGGKTVFLVFSAGERIPRFAIKLGRLRHQNPALEAECANLIAVRQYADGPRIQIPKILLSREVEGHVVLVESVIEGMSLWEVAARTGSYEYVAPVVDWLVHLGRITARASGDRDHRNRHLSALVELLDRHVVAAAERDSLNQAAGLIQPLEREAIPVVYEQRDMGTWNLMVSRTGEIGIVDWESACPEGFPAWDLFYFLAHYGFMIHGAVERKGRLESFTSTFFSDAGFGHIAARTIRQYAQSLELKQTWLVPLFLGCWLQHTYSEVSRLGIAPSESLFWQFLTATLERLDRTSALSTSWD